MPASEEELRAAVKAFAAAKAAYREAMTHQQQAYNRLVEVEQTLTGLLDR